MIADLEQRKVEALEWINNPQAYFPAGVKEAIRELLAPSPQVPDREVEKACELLDDEIYSEFGNSPLGMKLQNAVHILRKAAQHPQREEWRTMESALQGISKVVEASIDGLQSEMVRDKNDNVMWAFREKPAVNFRDRIRFLVNQALPSPPKAEK